MYEAFFGLRNRPFSPLPRVDSFIPLAPLREPLESLIRCLSQEQGIGVLTAPQGSGKSLICRLLQHHFQHLRRTVLLTTARFPTRRSLLQAILFELKHPYVGLSEQEARLRVFDLLQASPAPLNRMLLIVDEAHLLSPRGIEELRTLTDYELAGTPCVSLILSGQLELEERLTEPAMNAFNQRVGCHVCIEPLTYEESSQYIRERLRLAGNDGLTIFTSEAIQLICSASEGSPRRLNQLCDHSLLLAFAEEERPIDVLTVRAALLDLRELPLHWNAPLDLANASTRNPLEAFVESYETDEAAMHDNPLAECDTDIDLEDDSALDHDDAELPTVSGTSVFEVGSGIEESPFEQLFHVTQFSVPGEYRNANESHPSPEWQESSDAHATYGFETAPPEEQTQDETVFEDNLPGRGFEFGGELVIGALPLIPAIPRTQISCGFEEIDVDDAYAVIDRQLELTGVSLRSPDRRTPHNPIPPSMNELPVASAAERIVEVEEAYEDIDDTLFDEPLTLNLKEIPDTFEPPLLEVEPLFLESQLLDFINEISVDVRRTRAEIDASRMDIEQADHPALSLDELKLHRHQSLRQTLNWQFDVVEPDEENRSSVRPITETQVEPDVLPQPDSEVTPQCSEVASTQESHSSSPAEERRYAQLFTRLQRQRRRVEAVMNRERRT